MGLTITQLLVIIGTGPRGLRNGNLFGKRELSARRTIKQVPLDEIKAIVLCNGFLVTGFPSRETARLRNTEIIKSRRFGWNQGSRPWQLQRYIDILFLDPPHRISFKTIASTNERFSRFFYTLRRCTMLTDPRRCIVPFGSVNFLLVINDKRIKRNGYKVGFWVNRVLNKEAWLWIHLCLDIFIIWKKS